MESITKGSEVHTERVGEPLCSDSKMTVAEYLTTRITSLKPPMTPAGNPIKQLGFLNREQWAFFAVSYSLGFAWL